METIQRILEEFNKSISEIQTQELGLMGGKSGIIVFKSYATKKYRKSTLLMNIFNEITNSINNERAHHTYAYGISGLIDIVDIVKKTEWDTESKLALISYLIKYGTFELKKNNYDYLHGYLGIALGLLKFESTFASSCVQQLQQSKIKNDAIIYWKYSGLKREISGDLGLAHGSAGILAILVKFYTHKIERELCYLLISEIVTTFKICKRIGNDSLYGYVIDEKENSRLSWCYGDLGIARSIWLAGVACNREDWKQEAIDIMLHAAKRRDLQKNGVVDAGICHGTAGIAHIFNRFYRDTQLDAFKGATDYWIDQTFKMAKFKDGLAGYKSWQGPVNGWKKEYGLLEGIAGIGLVLHSYLHPEIEPTWDRCLLLS